IVSNGLMRGLTALNCGLGGPEARNNHSNDIDSLVIKNSDDVGKYFALLFINYIYSDRCFELWICIGICKRMWANDNNWDGIWCNTRLCPIFGKKFRDIGCQTVKYDK
ncbi:MULTISPECIES: hypothetical protein, partial [unclassified Eubacterium (in: firmicutes)]|uniref:hypothetical protein n=1 Tax=unclassified Eubacterium (in: firmicutes) TaxID=2624479 RepID=UPI0019D69B89